MVFDVIAARGGRGDDGCGLPAVLGNPRFLVYHVVPSKLTSRKDGSSVHSRSAYHEVIIELVMDGIWPLDEDLLIDRYSTRYHLRGFLSGHTPALALHKASHRRSLSS
ncbi:hypothetical protein PM082_020706 [Marasmius tenuissimus]|nr:hypothetical protein PM082_020706 [Marasmius tenuissimus]